MAAGGAISGDLSEVKCDPITKSRGLFAKHLIKTGDTIVVEDPIVSSQLSWNRLYLYAACHHCMQSLETTLEMARRLSGNPHLEIPYPEYCPTQLSQHTMCDACRVAFCSEECKQRALSSYHKVICCDLTDEKHPLAHLDDIWRNSHFPPETATIMLIVRMVALVLQSPDQEEVFSQFATFCDRAENEEEQICHKLMGDKFQEQIESLRLMLTNCFPQDQVQHWFAPEGFRRLLALIGTNSQGIGSSSLAVWAKRVENLDLPQHEKEALDDFLDNLYDAMEQESGQFLNAEGVGLYLQQSACNHSCLPNAEITFPFNNHRLVMVAKENIMPGEEIFISYLQDCILERSRHTRRKYLRDNYLFNCNCARCIAEQDEPDVTSSDSDSEGEEMVTDSTEAAGDSSHLFPKFLG